MVVYRLPIRVDNGLYLAEKGAEKQKLIFA